MEIKVRVYRAEKKFGTTKVPVNRRKNGSFIKTFHSVDELTRFFLAGRGDRDAKWNVKDSPLWFVEPTKIFENKEQNRRFWQHITQAMWAGHAGVHNPIKIESLWVDL